MPFKVLKGTFESLAVLGRVRPDAVLVTGGYVSMPVGTAAWIRGIPLVVHESNAVPGLVNRFLGRLAKKVCLTYPGPEGPRYRVTGNPVRLAGKLPGAAASRKAFGLDPGVRTLLVFPGSQAAHKINVALRETLGRWKGPRFQVLWMCGKKDEAACREAAKRLPSTMKASVQSFIHDVASAYAAADLVLARAGAATLAEITVSGLPSILVPYPHATGRHQDANAAAMARAGASEVVEDSAVDAATLGGKIRELLFDRKKLAAMAAASRALGKPEAAAAVLEVIEGVSC
jgi:UDP-N-acetylglucosamine--N-acetylmuramyl-(pentapeptide) pyrophosphoryl-undecaprenol N-acetylglucosamine transferase